MKEIIQDCAGILCVIIYLIGIKEIMVSEKKCSIQGLAVKGYFITI